MNIYQGIFRYILGNLRVRMSMPLEKFFQFYFSLKHPKITFPEGGDEAASALVLKSMCPFNFPEVSFCFLELPFCFSEVPFYFSKMPYCYPKLPRSNVFFIYCTRLFPRMIFFLLTVTSCPAQSCLQR